MSLTQERLKELLHYAPETGVFTWISNSGPANLVGRQAGSVGSKGYRAIQIDKKPYRENRLAWLYMKGRWPEHTIDHENGIRADNKFSNLRDLPVDVNIRCKRDKVTRGGMLTGIDLYRGRYRVRIQVDGKRLNIGRFDTLDEAANARKVAKESWHSLPT